MEDMLAAPSVELHPLTASALLLPAFLVCVLVPIILLKLAASSKPRLCLPPAPPALPFIGHLHLLGTHPHHSLSNLSRVHGALMLLRFGSVPALIASTPAMARQILQTHDKTFCSRPQLAASVHLSICDNIALAQPGPAWKLMRQICATDLVGSKHIESFRPVIAEEVNALLCFILDSPDDVAMRARLSTATANIISRMVLGKRLADLAPRSQADASCHLMTLVAEAIRLIGVFNVGDFIPCLAWLDLQGCIRESKAIAQKLHASLQEVIDGRREIRRQYGTNSSTQCQEQHDFLDALIGASEQKHNFSIKDSNIRAVLTVTDPCICLVMDLYAAGIDTSSVSTEWALYELLGSPTKMKKLQAELEHVVGLSRLVQVTDIPQLPYLQAVVKETMRLHPVLPLLVPHKASQECKVGGYDIPAGAVAYVNVWAIGRDPDVWDKPLEFRPERFLGSDRDVRGQHFELLPFGSGRRACPGMLLGLLVVQFLLASLVHCFTWSAKEEVSMSERFGIVVAPEKPLVATGTVRVASHLLEM